MAELPSRRVAAFNPLVAIQSAHKKIQKRLRMKDLPLEERIDFGIGFLHLLDVHY